MPETVIDWHAEALALAKQLAEAGLETPELKRFRHLDRGWGEGHSHPLDAAMLILRLMDEIPNFAQRMDDIIYGSREMINQKRAAFDEERSRAQSIERSLVNIAAYLGTLVTAVQRIADTLQGGSGSTSPTFPSIPPTWPGASATTSTGGTETTVSVKMP